MSTAAVRRHWARVAALGCIVCGGPAEIAHCHGGSIVERMQEPKAKGRKLSRYDWLVLPLCPNHHRDTSINGLDRNVEEWEDANPSQSFLIDMLCVELDIDLWAKANEGRK